ncbi:MAG: hypothetical protein ACK5NY_09810, partial [Burkholderiaceae bacterium]
MFCAKQRNGIDSSVYKSAVKQAKKDLALLRELHQQTLGMAEEVLSEVLPEIEKNAFSALMDFPGSLIFDQLELNRVQRFNCDSVMFGLAGTLHYAATGHPEIVQMGRFKPETALEVFDWFKNTLRAITLLARLGAVVDERTVGIIEYTLEFLKESKPFGYYPQFNSLRDHPQFCEVKSIFQDFLNLAKIDVESSLYSKYREAAREAAQSRLDGNATAFSASFDNHFQGTSSYPLRWF